MCLPPCSIAYDPAGFVWNPQSQMCIYVSIHLIHTWLYTHWLTLLKLKMKSHPRKQRFQIIFFVYVLLLYVSVRYIFDRVSPRHKAWLCHNIINIIIIIHVCCQSIKASFAEHTGCH
jgi:hypothetical protein